MQRPEYDRVMKEDWRKDIRSNLAGPGRPESLDATTYTSWEAPARLMNNLAVSADILHVRARVRAVYCQGLFLGSLLLHARSVTNSFTVVEERWSGTGERIRVDSELIVVCRLAVGRWCRTPTSAVSA